MKIYFIIEQVTLYLSTDNSTLNEIQQPILVLYYSAVHGFLCINQAAYLFTRKQGRQRYINYNEQTAGALSSSN